MLGIQFENPNRIDITDPVSTEFYQYFRSVAQKNALIYEEVFATLPSDRVRTFAHLNGYTDVPKLKDTDPLRVRGDARCSTAAAASSSRHKSCSRGFKV